MSLDQALAEHPPRELGFGRRLAPQVCDVLLVGGFVDLPRIDAAIEQALPRVQVADVPSRFPFIAEKVEATLIRRRQAHRSFSDEEIIGNR